MRRLVSHIQQRVPRRDLVRVMPKASLGALPMLVSFELGFALMAGYFAAHFFAGKDTASPNRANIPSLIFQVAGWRVHLHHWLVFLGIFIIAAIANFFVVTPLVFYGFLGGVIVQGVLYYDDWTRVVSRQRHV